MKVSEAMGTAGAEAQKEPGHIGGTKRSPLWLELEPSGESVAGEKVEGQAEARSREVAATRYRASRYSKPNRIPLGAFKEGDHMISVLKNHSCCCGCTGPKKGHNGN